MKRPRGVTIIGSLLIVQGLVGILTAGVIIAAHFPGLSQQLPSEVRINLDITSAGNWTYICVYAIISLLALTGGFALLLMRPWAWTVAMLVQGYALVIDLWTFFQGEVLYLQMLLAIVIVFYLNTREVRSVFQTRQHPMEDAPLLDAHGTGDGQVRRNSAEASPTTSRSVIG
jgi:hypothetical protein